MSLPRAWLDLQNNHPEPADSSVCSILPSRMAQLLPAAWVMGCECHCRVPNAKPGREAMDKEIFGMAGVPSGMEPGAALPEGIPVAILVRLW